MKKVGLLVILLAFLPATLPAQTPEFEVFGGYSHLFANLNAPSFNMNGAHISFAQNANSWFGGVADLSFHYGTENGFKVNTQSIMYGPEFSYRKQQGFRPFGHILLGVVRGGNEFLGISESAAHFGLAAGGGVDVKVHKHVSIRVFEADYLMTHFLKARQDNLRVSAGVVFNFGTR
jgi:opacity protein-like surface antigen